VVAVSLQNTAEIRQTARSVAAELDVPYATFIRPSAIDAESLAAKGNEGDIRFAADHSEAAKVALSFGRGVLLTTGSKNLDEYVAEARRVGLPLHVRVLSRDESLKQCKQAGVSPERTIAGRGPFDVEENRRHIRQSAAGVLVTKDGGQASGVTAKLEAARLEKCTVVVVRRPAVPVENALNDPESLAQHVLGLLEDSSSPEKY